MKRFCCSRPVHRPGPSCMPSRSRSATRCEPTTRNPAANGQTKTEGRHAAMHIEPLRTTEPRHATGSRMGGRSLPRRYTFLSQDRDLRFAAESCIEVLKAANRLTGSETYEWTLGAGEETDLHTSTAGPGAGLVLIGGTERPWMPSPAALPQLRAGIRSAARLCVVGSAVFVPLAAGLLRGDRVAVHPRFHPGMQESATEIEI